MKAVARSAQLIERAQPLGRELVCLLDSGLAVIADVPPDEDARFDAELDAAIEAFRGRGWVLGE